MEQKHKGAASELIAVIWLLKEGYEVYRNVSAHGTADILAIKDNKITKIDVKTCVIRKNDGSFYHAKHSKKHIEQDVKILSVDLEKQIVVGFSEPNQPKRFHKCEMCGKDFQIWKDMQKFCSTPCRNENRKIFMRAYSKQYKKNNKS